MGIGEVEVPTQRFGVDSVPGRDMASSAPLWFSMGPTSLLALLRDRK